jgi:hypothetical protein
LELGVGSGLPKARILRLSASSPAATSGVSLAGSTVAPNGSWKAPAPTESGQPSDGVLDVQLQPSSAVLLTLARPRIRSHAQARSPSPTRR